MCDELKKSKEASVDNLKLLKNGELHEAIITRQNDKVRLLLEQSEPNDSLNYFGESPIHCAVKTPNYKALKLLIEHKIDLNQQNKPALSPLAYSILLNADSSFELLLESGADVDQVQFKSNPRVPLILAIESHSYEKAQILLHFGAKVNSRILDTILEGPLLRYKRCVDLLMKFDCKIGLSKRYNNIREIREFLIKQGVIIDGNNVNRTDIKKIIYYNKCIKEIESMKMIYLNSRVTLYNFLMASRNKLINYSKDKNLSDEVEKLLRSGKFEIYENFIRINSLIGSRYGRLYDKVNFYDPVGRYLLPILVRDNVLKYLNERDINNLIRAQNLR